MVGGSPGDSGTGESIAGAGVRGEKPAAEQGEPVFVRVAVPVPLPGALTYRVPEALRGTGGLGPAPGCRVKVEVGRRKLLGVVTATGAEAPHGMRIKSLLEVLDLEPAIPQSLLELAHFVADYYLSPLGEAVRLLVPADLPPWGDGRVSLTDAGALAAPGSAAEERLVAHLLEHPRIRLAELGRALDLPELPRLLEDLRRRGRISIEEPGRRGGGFVKAVERAPGELADQLEAAGRSRPGREVLQYLDALGRPATLRELRHAVGCGTGVIRRLGKLGLVRELVQRERLDLDRHRIGEAAGPAEGELILRDDQARAVTEVDARLHAGTYRPFLLHGMTGSGKTEVYLRSVRTCLDLGRGAILMVPEIALVPALAGQLRRRFGRELAILHSNLSSGERQQEWERIRRGAARVVVGPRSALWAPVADLGLIVVDEEHDGSYKQDKAPRYNGRDLALLRARNSDAVAVLVSATPSLESRHNVDREKLGYLRLVARAGGGSAAGGRLPEGLLVDLRREAGARRPGEVPFSGLLLREIRAAVEAGDQVILLRNRRGYAPVLLCRACGEDFRCEDCGLNLTYHLRGHRLQCHYCGREQAAPRSCTKCGEAALEPMGAGTERVEERLRELFPGVAVDLLDADASRRTGGAAAVLERFSQGKTQVLVGTQMVSKGHHFPRVSLAAVLFADTYLGFPDFRAVERTYALLTQLAGRAGRGDRPGKVIVQTYHPEHYAIRAVLDGDDAGFAEQEMRFRRIYHYPPYTRMVQVLAQNKVAAKARGLLEEVQRRILARAESRRARILGPSPAPFERLRGRWRFQLVLRGPSGSALRRLVRSAVADLPPSATSDLVLDVDPYDLL
ncbi:MAG: primosomal protein N' [Holophagales bacterium]|nr:primosomal protein N' [Holophagales bacterium]